MRLRDHLHRHGSGGLFPNGAQPRREDSEGAGEGRVFKGGWRDSGYYADHRRIKADQGVSCCGKFSQAREAAVVILCPNLFHRNGGRRLLGLLQKRRRRRQRWGRVVLPRRRPERRAAACHRRPPPLCCGAAALPCSLRFGGGGGWVVREWRRRHDLFHKSPRLSLSAGVIHTAHPSATQQAARAAGGLGGGAGRWGAGRSGDWKEEVLLPRRGCEGRRSSVAAGLAWWWCQEVVGHQLLGQSQHQPFQRRASVHQAALLRIPRTLRPRRLLHSAWGREHNDYQ